MDSLEDRARVSEKIGFLIKEFFITAEEFHMTDLNNFIQERIGVYVAPDSPGRIMRSLRQKGEINYVLVDRSKSKYRKSKKWELF